MRPTAEARQSPSHEALTVADDFESRAEVFKDPPKARAYWLAALKAADDEEKEFREQGTKTWKLYSGKTKASFNILHSNVETTVPAIFNSVPVPDCRPRYSDKNEVAREAAQVLERALAYEVDEYDIAEHLKKTVYDMEIPGRGVAWVEFDPLIQPPTPAVDPATQQPAMGADGKPAMNPEKVIWASVRCQYLPWQRFRRGPGATWDEVQWVEREKFLTRDELVKLAGPEIGKQITLDATQSEASDKDNKSHREKSVWKCARVHEIWDKESRKVWYIATGFDKGPIAIVEDPLKLKDFFPTPRPMQCLSMDGSLVPINRYSLYQSQADELDKVSTRILSLIQQAKFCGVYASEIADIENIDSLNDGQFIASKEAMQLLQNNGALDKAFWVKPVDGVILLIRELVAQRETIKQTIYELSGIADIMRGASNANETLGAQNLKARWGSLRVQNRQSEVQRYCRDLYRLKAEIISEHFPDDVLSMIAGEPLKPEVIQLLRSDVQRRFMVDIETDSTIAADRTRDQEQMTAFLDASGRFMQLATGATAAGIPPELPLVIYQSFASKFKLGKQVDDVIAKLMESAQPIMEQKQQADAEAKAKQQEAEQIAKAGAVAEVENKQATAEKTKTEVVGQQIENQGQAIENQRQAVTPITAPAQPQKQGFVQ
jgi:hypothetical protein